jgi:hypothetical protein
LNRTLFWRGRCAYPADVLVNRKGSAVMRLLDIDYRVIKKASEMRGVLDAGSRRWATVETSTHSDISEWSLLVNLFHSDEASHEDNTLKAPVRIDITTNLSAKSHIYELHTARTYRHQNSLVQTISCLHYHHCNERKALREEGRSASHTSPLSCAENDKRSCRGVQVPSLPSTINF